MEDPGDSAVAVQRELCPDGQCRACLAPARDHRRRAVAAEDVHRRQVRAQKGTDGVRDGREDLHRRRLLGDEHRDTTQGRLLLRKPRQFAARLRIGDRRRDESGELAKPQLRHGRQRLSLARRGDDGAPQAPFDDDWSGNRRANAQDARHGCHRAGGTRPVVHPNRLPGAKHLGDDVLAVERETGAQGRRIPRRIRLCEERRRLVWIEAKQPHGLTFQDAASLFGDRAENLYGR
jgi:hypothetical protein